MDAVLTVTVYNFRDLAGHAARFQVFPFKTTRERVADHYRGEVLEGTAEEVPADELDAHGRYRRIATGWGELS